MNFDVLALFPFLAFLLIHRSSGLDLEFSVQLQNGNLQNAANQVVQKIRDALFDPADNVGLITQLGLLGKDVARRIHDQCFNTTGLPIRYTLMDLCQKM